MACRSKQAITKKRENTKTGNTWASGDGNWMSCVSFENLQRAHANDARRSNALTRYHISHQEFTEPKITRTLKLL